MDETQKPNGQPVHIWRVWHISEGAAAEQEVEMVLEEPLSLHINGQQAAVLMRLPGMEKELVAGFCISEGLVRRFDDILMIHHCGQGLPAPSLDAGLESDATSRNRVEVRVRPEGLNADARLDVVRLIRAGCGAVDVERADLPLSPVPAGPVVTAQRIIQLPQAMRERQQLHQQVGGVHAVALFDTEGQPIILCEDVGRHNAVDKAIGYCLLRGISIADRILLCSGRLSYEMVTKIIRLGISILVSVSAPTALAVQLAESFGVTIIGYVRGSRMTIYTHPERILMPSA